MDASRPSYVPVAPPRRFADEPLQERALRYVQHNQLASMVGAFALGVFLGVLARS